jgi:hypothetical protein
MSADRVARRWTTLPPLSLHGIGTPMVESLEHYISRLAFASGISLTRLYGELCRGESDHNAARKVAANGVSSRVASIVFSLNEMTGSSTLHCGTFLNLRHVLNNFGVEYRARTRRWCPLCFVENDLSTGYDPLIWRVSALTHCPIHCCALVDRCPSCNRQQRLPCAYAKRRSCSHCDTSLASAKPIAVGGVYADHVARCSQELVAICADPQQEAIALRDIQPFFDEVRFTLMRVCAAGERPEDLTIMPFVEFGRLTLRRFIELCAIQSIGPSDILLRPRESGGGQLLPRFIPDWTYAEGETRVEIRISTLVEMLRYLQKPKRLELFLPSLPRLLRIARVGRNVFIDAARLSYRGYRERYRSQGEVQAVRDAERALASALARVRKKSFPSWDHMQLRWSAFGISKECGVTTIVARKCVRTALWILDRESKLQVSEHGLASARPSGRRHERDASRTVAQTRSG